MENRLFIGLKFFKVLHFKQVSRTLKAIARAIDGGLGFKKLYQQRYSELEDVGYGNRFYGSAPVGIHSFQKLM